MNTSLRCSNVLWCLVVIQIAIILVYLVMYKSNVRQLKYQSYLSSGSDPRTPFSLTRQADGSNLFHYDHSAKEFHGPKTTVAIGMGITTVHIKDYTRGQPLFDHLPFLNTLLMSFCRTASPGFSFNFYLAYDFNDTLLSNSLVRQDLFRQFSRFVQDKRMCQPYSTYSLTYVECQHSGKPAFAQNDAMIQAYLAGNQYFYRVNDDTILETSDWTRSFVDILSSFDPPNVGVVGPQHSGGNIDILTYDFVHRKHIEVFGFYYPREFPNWYADGWITNVYKPGRMAKVSSVLVKHTQELGRRYKVTKNRIARTKKALVIDRGKEILIRYLSSTEQQSDSNQESKSNSRIISMALWDSTEDILWGLVRNAQLQRVYYPQWTMRVYSDEHPVNRTRSRIRSVLNKNNVLLTLRDLGVEIIVLNNSTIFKYVPKFLWHLTVADDPNVSEFLIRDPRQRFSQREADAVNDWISNSNETKTVHCQRDHPSQTKWPMVNGLWGATANQLRNILKGNSMASLLSSYSLNKPNNTFNDITFANSFLRDVIWPNVTSSVMCHDSVSCDNLSIKRTFTKPRPKFDFIGNFYDSHEMRVTNFKFWQMRKRCNQEE